MTTECGNCKKSFPIEKMFECEFCNKTDDSDEDSDKEEIKEPKISLCKRCSDECFVCELRGCDECLRTVCCDCSVSMCKECENGDDLCGCYGNCYWCDRDVDRGTKAYDYSHNKNCGDESYMYIYSIGHGFWGSFYYFLPIFFPILIHALSLSSCFKVDQFLQYLVVY